VVASFDRVNHDKLMGQIAKRVEDKRLLKLIRAFLNAGVMENGLVSPSVEGTPQGGPLSPLLSILVLDELDRELERRGHRFVRYADDSNIYVRSERAGQRVMESITQFIPQKLKLKVNEAKSAVARPQKRKFLGFSFSLAPVPPRWTHILVLQALGFGNRPAISAQKSPAVRNGLGRDGRKAVSCRQTACRSTGWNRSPASCRNTDVGPHAGRR
jgi:hypothetical protein